jgi:hypothetical protein
MENRIEIMLNECRSICRQLLKEKESLVTITDPQLDLLKKLVTTGYSKNQNKKDK